MEGELDIVTAVCAICVAAYAAIAIGYVAYFDLGFSIQQIRGAALAIAVLMAAFIVIDFFSKKLGKTKSS